MTAERWSRDTAPYGAAGIINVDEVIDPADTRAVLARALAYGVQPPLRGHRKPLQSWPTCL